LIRFLGEKPRSFGGAGFTGVMNVTVGPVEFDTNNDDRIDVKISHTVEYLTSQIQAS